MNLKQSFSVRLLKLLYLHNRMKYVLVQIVDNYITNNLMEFHCSILGYLNDTFGCRAH